MKPENVSRFILDSLSYVIPVDLSDYGTANASGGPQMDFGYVHQNVLFLNTLTVKEHIEFVAHCRLRSSDGSARRHKAAKLLRQFRLVEKQDVRIQHLSGGEQKRLAFASAFIHDPGTIYVK